jgi:hypothetical protein
MWHSFDIDQRGFHFLIERALFDIVKYVQLQCLIKYRPHCANINPNDPCTSGDYINNNKFDSIYALEMTFNFNKTY